MDGASLFPSPTRFSSWFWPMGHLFKSRVGIRLPRRIVSCPCQRALQILSRLRRVQPKLVFRDHLSCANEPNPWFTLFHQHLPTGELLAEGDLAIRADDLDAGFNIESIHYSPFAPLSSNASERRTMSPRLIDADAPLPLFGHASKEPEGISSLLSA